MPRKHYGLYPLSDDPESFIPGVPAGPHNQTGKAAAEALEATGRYRIGEPVEEPTETVPAPETEPEPVAYKREPYFWLPPNMRPEPDEAEKRPESETRAKDETPKPEQQMPAAPDTEGADDAGTRGL